MTPSDIREKPLSIVRVAPFGNRTGNLYGEFPHYHRMGKASKKGIPSAGQSKDRHRPWEPSVHDKSFWDRF